MKMLKTVMVLALVAMACQEAEMDSPFTGNETVYDLQAGSDYPVSGTATVKERKDGYATIVISLTGTAGTAKHPAHLHRGTLATPGAEVAALLSPVDAATGTSETLLTQLADETPVSYTSLIEMEACIKVHLSDTGDGRNVVLAGGNIGVSFTRSASGGRQGMALCKSE